MSYELEAYLVPPSALEGKQNHTVPKTVYRLTDELGLISLCGTVHLAKNWPIRASKGTTIARVSADYFGGYGGQSATVWSDGKVVAENVEVNTALRRLGVTRTGGQDEWDCVGLGRFRRTETWAAEAIRANWKLGDKPLEKLLEALRYTSQNEKQQEKVRAAAAKDLGELGDEAAIPHLVDAVKARDEQALRIAAAGALAEIGGPALAQLAEQLREEEADLHSKWDLFRSRLRIAVAKTLVKIGRLEPTVLAERQQEEESYLNSKRDSFRFFPVIHALGEAGPAAGPFADDLVIMLRHWHAGTRGDAAQALGKIGPAAANAVPALIEALGDEESFVRSYAAQALGEIGPAAQPAAQALSTCLRDEIHYVRDNPKAALAAIEENPDRD
jgi:HEAT repeat protein